MNIKSLLIGSAAAFAAVSGAQAADAIVAAEPEPMEYVRVCDAFGTGFFYIPGTETCLKIGGYVRFQADFGEKAFGQSDWEAWSRARLEIQAKSDTELGTLTSFTALQIEAGNNSVTSGASGAAYIDEAYIELGGFRIGTFLNWWDSDMAGETEVASTTTRFTSARYVYDGGTFLAGLSLDEIPDSWGTTLHNDFGVSGMVKATLGGVTFELLGAYDDAAEEGAVRAWLTADVGPGKFELMGLYASGFNNYYDAAEWSVAVDYSFAATEKLSITPGFQYLSDTNLDLPGKPDQWRVGVTFDYQVVDNLKVKATVNYRDDDLRGDAVTGFLRLDRSF